MFTSFYNKLNGCQIDQTMKPSKRSHQRWGCSLSSQTDGTRSELAFQWLCSRSVASSVRKSRVCMACSDFGVRRVLGRKRQLLAGAPQTRCFRTQSGQTGLLRRTPLAAEIAKQVRSHFKCLSPEGVRRAETG